MILNAQDDPVTDDQISHAVTKITCFCECAKGGDMSGVESVSLKGFVQFSDGKLVELLYYLRQVISIARTVKLKAINNL